MPVMDGYEATKKIREFEDETLLPSEPKALIVGLSGHSTETFKEQGYKAGMDYFSMVVV